jgi:hypothetical protein
VGSGLVVVGVRHCNGQDDDGEDTERDDPALSAAGFPGLDTLSPEESPNSKRERKDDHGNQADPSSRGRGGNTSYGECEPKSVL